MRPCVFVRVLAWLQSPFPAAVAEIFERFICAVATGATHESVLHVDAPVEDIIDIRTYVCACRYARMCVCMYTSSRIYEFSPRHNTRSQTKCHTDYTSGLLVVCTPVDAFT